MISFREGTSRNTRAYVVRVASAKFYISYETVIAASGYVNGEYQNKRLHNRWGTTTGRHITEMGVRMFEEVEDDEFDKFVDALVIDAVKDKLVSTIEKGQ